MSEILGIGTDIVEIARIRKCITTHQETFLNRLFTENERLYCDKHKDPTPHYAARFAAKEAVVKALGTGFGKKISWKDIEIERDEKGKPSVQFSPKLRKELSSSNILISLSHEKHYVTAVALWIKFVEL